MFENKAEMLRQLDDLFARIKKLEGHKVVGVNATMLHMYEDKVRLAEERAQYYISQCAQKENENLELQHRIKHFEFNTSYINPHDIADAKLRSENEALGAKVRVLSKRVLGLKTTIADKNADIDTLRKENVAETRKSADIFSVNTAFNQDIERLSRELQELERVIGEKNKYIEMLRGCSPEVLKRDNDRLVQELKECHRIRDKQADTIFDFQTKVKKVRVLNANQAETICDLTDKLKEYEGSDTHTWSVAARLNMTESILEKKGAEIERLKSDKAFLQDEAFRWEQRHRDVKSTLERKQYELDRIQDKLEKSVSREAWDEIRANTERLRKEIKVLKGANEYKKEEIARLFDTIKDRDAYIERSKEVTEGYHKEMLNQQSLKWALESELKALKPNAMVYVLTYQYQKSLQIQIAGVFSSHVTMNKWLKENSPASDEVTKVFTYAINKGEL